MVPETSLMIRLLLLALASLGFAADLPRYSGYVNDFAGRLEPEQRDALETRLRDYDRATTNEVAIAIVESLNGESVNQYAQDLFHAWGIGKKDRNNGVLLLWAPVERKVRIQVGYGLEGTLSDSAAADILRSVTDSFRREDYYGGLNAGVDGIIARLGGDAAPQESRSGIGLLIPLAGIGGVIFAIVMLTRAARKKQLAASVPKDLARASEAMREAETLRRNIDPALDELRREAPAEIWREFDGLAASAPGELAKLQQELDGIQLMPRDKLSELSRAHGALKRWNVHFSSLWERLEAVGKRLDGFRYCREHSQAMLRELGESLERRGSGGGWGTSAKLLTAAGETYSRAVAAAAMNPVNWLLVYDLLIDTQDCLACADNPGGYQRPVRYWVDSVGYSPATDLLMMQVAARSSSSSSFDSRDSSFSDSGGGGDSGDFGGGDSGGGGSSSDY
jgi:uncharacterized membrane protein YgcG